MAKLVGREKCCPTTFTKVWLIVLAIFIIQLGLLYHQMTNSPGSLYCARTNSTLWKGTKPNRTLYFTPIGSGRFGNQLFAFASLYGLAKETNHVPALPQRTLSSLRKVFDLESFRARSPPWDGRGCVMIAERYSRKFVPEVFPGLLYQQNDVIISGYLQVAHYFSSYVHELREILTIKESLVRKARQFLDSALSKYIIQQTTLTNVGHMWAAKEICNFTYVAVHVRRGDLLWKKYRSTYRVASEGYIERAMDYFRKKNKNVVFIVCSDSQDWVEQRMRYRNDVIVLPAASPQLHLAALTLCNHTVMTVGTFGWWAGWLAGGEVVYFPNPLLEAGRFYQNFRQNDHFPSNWIPLE